MKTPKLKTVFTFMLVAVCIVGLLMSLSACKKKPVKNPQDDSSTGTSASNSTQDSAHDNTEESASDNTEESTKESVNDATEETEETKAACKHKLGSWEVEKASTCTTEGSRYKKCSLCKEKVEVEAIPKISHVGGNWIVDKAATCTAGGKAHQECTQCKEKLLYITLDKADHKTTKVDGYPATQTTPGRTDKLVCKNCDAVVQEALQIPALGSVEYLYTVNADNRSCTITGVRTNVKNALILPDTISGYTVTGIGDKAFLNSTAVKTVYLPSSIRGIGAHAFSGCVSLTNITYQGTTAQWNSLSKDTGWNANTGNYTIYCTNNSIVK